MRKDGMNQGGWTVVFILRVLSWPVPAARAVEHAGGRNRIWSIAVDPVENRMAGAGENGTIQVFDLKEGVRQATLRGHRAGARSVAFSQDGAWLASSSYDGTVIIWEVGTWKLARTWDLGREVRAVIWSPVSADLAAGLGDGSIARLEREREQPAGKFASHTDGIRKLAFMTGGRLVSGGNDGRIRIQSWPAGKGEWAFVGGTRALRAVAVYSTMAAKD